MLSALIAHISKYVSLSDSDIQAIYKHTEPVNVKKKDYLLKEGQICRSNYFVAEGCLRMFFINEKGSEQITQFAIEHWWLADYMSFTMQSASKFNIQAIEGSVLIALDHHKQEELLKEVPQLERYFRLMMQRAYAAMQQRFKFLYDFSKEDSYLHFVNNFPGFVQRVPQYMLASYLGFTPEYLSEIRKKIR